VLLFLAFWGFGGISFCQKGLPLQANDEPKYQEFHTQAKEFEQRQPWIVTNRKHHAGLNFMFGSPIWEFAKEAVRKVLFLGFHFSGISTSGISMGPFWVFVLRRFQIFGIPFLGSPSPSGLRPPGPGFGRTSFWIFGGRLYGGRCFGGWLLPPRILGEVGMSGGMQNLREEDESGRSPYAPIQPFAVATSPPLLKEKSCQRGGKI